MSQQNNFWVLTGATGFLGSEVLARLIQKRGGPEGIVLLTRSKPDSNSSLLAKRFLDHGFRAEDLIKKLTILEMDFSNGDLFRRQLQESLAPIVKNKFSIIHMAAMISAPEGSTLADQARANVGVTDDLMNFSVEQGADRFVFTSSVVAWGGIREPKIRGESDFTFFDPLCWKLPYFSTKRVAHERVLDTARKNKLTSSILCPGIIHGKLDYQKSSRSFLKLLVEERLPALPGGGGNIVGLDRVAASVVDEVLRERPDVGAQYTQLVVDENLSFVDYMKKYAESWARVKGRTVPRLPKLILPRGLGRGIGQLAGVIGKLAGKHLSLGEALIPGSMFLYFKSENPLPPTQGLDSALEDSIRTNPHA